MQTNDKFLSDLQELPEAGFKACAKAHGKTLEKLTDEAIEGVGDKLAGLLMEEMMNADDGWHRKTPEIFAALHKGGMRGFQRFRACKSRTAQWML